MSQLTKKWIAVAAGLAVLLCIGVLFGRPAYRNFKEERAVRQASEFAAEGDYRKAAMSLRIALALNPGNVVAAGLMAELLDKGQSPAALTFRKRVAELKPTLTNRLMYAACALRHEKPPYTNARAVLESLGAEAETNTAYHVLNVQLALALNRPSKAEEHLRSLIRLDPSKRLHSMNLSTILLQSKDAAVAARAAAELMAVSNDPVLGVTALRSLVSARLTGKDFPGAQELARRLTAHAGATLEDRFLEMTVLKAAGAAEFGTRLTALQQHCATNAASVARAITWMNGQGMATAALEWSRGLPKASRDATPVTIAEAGCYVALADFSGLQDHLTGP